MSYILPVPHYQYQAYQDRVIAASKTNYASIDPPVRVSLGAMQHDKTENNNHQSSKKRSKKAFHMHLAEVSGKGLTIDQQI